MLSKGYGRVESDNLTLLSFELQSPHPKPETRNPKPETRNPKPETRNPKPCPLGAAFILSPKLLAKGFNSFSIHSEVGIPNAGRRSDMNQIFFFVEQKLNIINKTKNERSKFSMKIIAGA